MRPAQRMRLAVEFMTEYCQMPPWDGDLQCLLTILGVFAVVISLSLIRGRK